jgi:ankyrin repeat protein
LLHGQDIDEAAIKTVTALLEAGCDPSCVEEDGSSIMHILAGFCDYEFVKKLLNEFQFKKYINARAGTSDRTPIHQVIAAGNVEVFNLLIEHGADTYVQVSGKTILHLLASMEDEDCAVLFLKALNLTSRKDKNIPSSSEDILEGLTAFELAVYSSHLKIAELLLDAGSDPEAVKDRDPHFLALLIGLPTWDSLRSLQYYLDRVETPFIIRKSNALSVLHMAASMMHYLADNLTEEQKFDLLLKRFSRDYQINAVTKRSGNSDLVAGQTPLHYAAKFGVFHAAQKLLQAGANPNAKDDDGKTPLDLARSQLASLGEMVMEHEMFRVITDLKSTVGLLERPKELQTIGTIQNENTENKMVTKFSRLGFQTQPSGRN